MKVKRNQTLKIILIGIGAVLVAGAAAAGGYVYNNLNYHKTAMRRTMRAGFVEKQVTLEDGTILNYGEGPDNGPALLLIHGQLGSWEDYARVLPALSEDYHVFAVDCHGHGGSSKDPAKYSAVEIGKDLAHFIEMVIGEPVVVSGHSSGGLLTAWLAANSPENVRGVVLEDPPFFTTEAPRIKEGFAWHDTFKPVHEYLAQSEEDDFVLYYLKNNYFLEFFGDSKQGIVNYAASYREKHPGQPLEFFFLPPSINAMFLAMDQYDPRFGDRFFDASWNEGFDHAEALGRIELPSILIHTNWSYNERGILLAAMSGDDAQQAHALISGNELVKLDSGHNVHLEKPKEFTRIMIDFLDKLPGGDG